MTGSPHAGLPSGTDPEPGDTRLYHHNRRRVSDGREQDTSRGHQMKARRLYPAAHIPTPDATNPTPPGTPTS